MMFLFLLKAFTLQENHVYNFPTFQNDNVHLVQKVCNSTFGQNSFFLLKDFLHHNTLCKIGYRTGFCLNLKLFNNF